MAEETMSREREIVLQRFLELEPKEQFAAYRAMRDCLAARLTLVKRDEAVEERAASLDAFRQVAAHLGLAAGVAPTPAQFDAVCRKLDLGWNRSRVGRAWGRWRFGRDAFLGHDHDSAVRRDIHQAVGGRRRQREAPLRAIRLWLATNPKNKTHRAYSMWAREYNSKVADGALPVQLQLAQVPRDLGMSWEGAVRYAAGEITNPSRAAPRKRIDRQMYSRGPHDLISISDVAPMLGCTPHHANSQAATKRFPAAVIDLPGGRLWLREDVVAYAAKKPFPQRQVNELRDFYLTIADVTALTDLPYQRFRVKRGFPDSVVQRGRIRLWLRDDVEAWKAAQT